MHFLRNFKQLSPIAFTTFLFLAATAVFCVFPAQAYYSGFLGSSFFLNSGSPYGYSPLKFYGPGNLGFYGLGSGLGIGYGSGTGFGLGTGYGSGIGYGAGIGYGFPASNTFFASGIPYYPAFINPLINNPLIPFASGLGSQVSPWFTSAIPLAPFLPATSMIPSYPGSYPGGLIGVVTPFPRSPSGRYTGTWTSLVAGTTHAMDLEIFVDSPTYIFQSSTVRLLSNELIPVAIDLAGTYQFSDNFTLTGTYPDPVSLVTYTLKLNCTYTFSGKFPRIIQGNYTIYDALNNTIVDRGTIYGESYDHLL
ncbi:MAG: hypothetical protein AB1847_08535 [bacterium]